MASIFKKSIVKDKVEKLVVPNFDRKVAIIKSWYNSYLSGTLHQKNERQCEQEFINDIFKEILGYTGFPAQPHTIIPQISSDTSAQRPDAGLGYFDGQRKRVFAVVEIKDVNTALDQSQRREGNLSPIQQAFKYKPQFKDCRFVIATNLYELRLFQDNQLDYEIFTLKSLADPANNHFELKRFILLLSQDNFVSGRGKSKTEELLAEIRVEQEKITKQFYSEYSDLRLKLMRDIWKNNEAYRNINLVADKAQKILDRIVFTCFCEDTGLLPDNTLLNVYKHAETSFSSIWDTLKGFFNAVDSGSEKLGIPNGYNGGLFHKDEELDVLSISDETCKSLSRIGQYDFENELTVNILGHVFEQSITDLEEIKKKVEPDEESQKSKRKKDGIFYTPEYIVDYIVQNSLGRYLRENEERIFNELKLNQAKTDKAYRERELKALQTYQEFLHNVKIVDPACGSGAFLVKVFDYLLEENRRIGNRIGGLFDQDHIFREILKNNIFGVDLNEESVRITQLSLWLKTAQKGKKLTYLDKNIRCGNSLIDDSSIAGKKAFKWSEEFKEVFADGGFDVVVGNPPYVFARGGNFKAREKSYYYKRFKLLNYQINTFLAFIELSNELIKQEGRLGFIIPNNWLTINSFSVLREFILKKCSDVCIFNSIDKVFNQASVDTCLLLFKKNPPTMVTLGLLSEGSIKVLQQADPKSFYSNDFVIKMKSDEKSVLTLKNCLTLKDIATVKSGIVAYEISKGKPQQTEEMKNERIYHSLSKHSEEWLKYLDGVDVGRYLIGWSGEYIKYGSNLAAQRKIDLFTQPRILVRQIPSKPPYCINATYVEEVYINDRNSNNILSINDEYPYLYVLGLINSSLISYWFVQTFDKFQRKIFPQFKVNELEKFPIHPASLSEKQSVVALVEKMIALQIKLNDELKKTGDLIKHQLGIQRLPIKITNLHDVSFDDLVKSAKTKLDIYEKSELLDFFNKQRDEVNRIRNEISHTNSEIDELVYKIYELQPEEILAINEFCQRS